MTVGPQILDTRGNHSEAIPLEESLRTENDERRRKTILNDPKRSKKAQKWDEPRTKWPEASPQQFFDFLFLLNNFDDEISPYIPLDNNPLKDVLHSGLYRTASTRHNINTFFFLEKKNLISLFLSKGRKEVQGIHYIHLAWKRVLSNSAIISLSPRKITPHHHHRYNLSSVSPSIINIHVTYVLNAFHRYIALTRGLRQNRWKSQFSKRLEHKR